MRCIGLTGGIATGKTTVATLLAGHGATVLDADALAREVVRPGGEALGEIARRFGEGVVRADGSLDRAALAEIVFADAQQRRDLEAITHPRIHALMVERLAQARRQGGPLAVMDVPLFFETGTSIATDGVLVVVTPADVQLARLMARDRLTEEQARRRIEAQLPLAEKRERATWVIDNGDGPATTAEQVNHWWGEVVMPNAGRA